MNLVVKEVVDRLKAILISFERGNLSNTFRPYSTILNVKSSIKSLAWSAGINVSGMICFLPGRSRRARHSIPHN